MAFTQDFRTQRRNYNDGESRIGEKDRLWYDSNTNSIRISDGETPGGVAVGGSGGGDYTLPTATTTVKGGVKVDGTTITISNQVISGFSGSYNDLTNKPTLFNGAYDSLSGKPTLFSGSYADLTNKPTLFSGSYTDLTDKPNLASTYTFNVAADDSTLRTIGTEETVKFIGAGGITTASDAEGNITITGSGGAYTLPTATDTVLGGVKIDGTTITINGSGVITANYPDTLAELTDTNVAGASNNQVLTWNTSTGKWIPTTVNGVDTLPTGIAYYGSFYDITATQTATSQTTAYVVNIGETTEANGVSIVSGNRITFAYAGTYEIEFSIQFHNVDNQGSDVNVWFRKNGADIADSNSRFTIPSKSNNNGYLIAVTPYLVTVAAGDYVQIVWSAEDNTTTKIETLAAGTTPTVPRTPGVIVLVNPVTSLIAPTTVASLTVIGDISTGTISFTDNTVQETAWTGVADYNNLTNKPTIPAAYTFNVAADDSTLRTIGTEETVKFIGANGITTGSDAEGAITITQGTTSSLVNGASTVSLSSTGTLSLPNNGKISSGVSIAPVGSSFSYAQNAFGSISDTGGVFLPSDTNSRAIVAGYTLVSNAGVTLTVTSISIVAGPPSFVSVSTTPTASSFTYPVTVYSADYVAGYTAPEWQFGTNGSLTFPNGTTQTTAAESFSFSVAADDSTQRAISNNELIKFIGAGGITTASDAEGAITITQGSTDQIIKVAGSFASDQPFKSEVIADLVNGVTINTWMGLPAFATTKSWKFGYNGNLTFPDTTVQTTAWTGSVSYTNVTDKPTLFSGSYNDLTNKPTIPSDVSDLTDNNNLLGGSGGDLVAGNYVVKAVKGGSAQTVTSGSDAIVTFVDDFDPQNWFSSNKFQPNVAGYYSIDTHVWWDAGAVTDNQSNIQLRKNGTTQVAISQNQILTGSGYAQSISTIVYFNGTTDYVEVTAFTGNTTSQNINGAGTGTYFTAALYAYGTFSGSYNDLTNKPTIPTNVSQLVNDSGYVTASAIPAQFTFNVAADDSTQRTVGSQETVKFIGAGGITTASDAEGNITITQGSSSSVFSNQYSLTTTTSNATETELLVNGSTRIPVSTNTSINYIINIAARRTDTAGDYAMFEIRGVAANVAGTVTDIGSVYEVVVARTNAGYLVDVRADDTNNSVNVYVTGVSGHTVDWKAVAQTIEV
jgi:hypothetical protein